MTPILRLALIATFALSSLAAAKGHDQGVADGQEPPAGPGALAGAVDDGQKNGQRGEAARNAKGENRTTPTSKPGQNKP
jgi:hypothetical protein